MYFNITTILLYLWDKSLKFFYFILFYLAVAIGHSRLWIASGHKRPLVDPDGQLDINYWPISSTKDEKH